MAMDRESRTAMIEGALCIALSSVLSKFNVFEMPQGGSIDLRLVPLLIFAWRRGVFWGLITGALNGVVKLLLGGYVMNVAQLVLDYPLAYSMVDLAALFGLGPVRQTCGVLLALLGQMICSVASGVLFFAEYAPEGQNPFVYSIVYNATTQVPKYILCGIVGWILWKALEKAGLGSRTRH